MPFLYTVEFLLTGLFVLLVATQVIWPLWTNSPVFPLLRKRVRAAEAALANASEKLDVERLNKSTAELLRYAELLRKAQQGRK